MKLFSRLRGHCYCAFCKSPRKIYLKKHVDLTNVLAALLLATGIGQTYYGEPDPRALVIFCVTIVLSEILVYLRWRTSLVCKLCGFDPLVYKRSPQAAADMVKAFYAEHEDDPKFWLTRSPLMERKRIHQERTRKASDYKALQTKILARSQKPGTSSLAPPKSP